MSLSPSHNQNLVDMGTTELLHVMEENSGSPAASVILDLTNKLIRLRRTLQWFADDKYGMHRDLALKVLRETL